jgi:hypothetical protein
MRANQIFDSVCLKNDSESLPRGENDDSESPDPNDSDLLRDQLKGETVEHAKPPRLEDEGQSGG